MAQRRPCVYRLKSFAHWNDCKGVKNPPVLYVINAGVVEDTGGSLVGFYNLYPLGITHKA